MNEKKILFVGLPSTGKTTFLAALWHLVCSDLEDKSLRLNNLKGDQEYLNTIREAWLNYEPVRRTLLEEGTSKLAEMTLENSITNEKIILTIPDLSGEMFRLALEQRQWSEELDNLVSQTEGILLFINPLKVNRPALILEAQEYSNILDEEDSSETNNVDSGILLQNDLQVWNHDVVPLQVKIVDLIQLLVSQKFESNPLKIALIISVWDMVETNLLKITPKTWLETTLPLLHQYIHCNKDFFNLEVFGVSAQGADYKTGNLDPLFEKEDPAERIIVKKNSEYSNDIALPIVWVTDQL